MAKEKEHTFDADIESYITSMLSSEVEVGKSNRDSDNNQFELVIDMFEGKRPVKDYEWYSNLSLKEATSILLTDCSTAVNQYFQTRDFVEVRLEGDDVTDLPKCRAAKKCINKLLNDRRLRHYQKFTRAKNINNMASHVYAVCEWEQEVEKKHVGFVTNWQENGIDEFGRIIWDPIEEPVIKEIIKIDRFNYDIYDPRNVFTSDEYTYCIQDKEWVILRSEQSHSDLKGLEDKNGYINLDAVKKLTEPTETEASREISKGKTKNKSKKSPIKKFDLYTRFGKMWAIVEEKTDDGLPKKIKPGYDKDGNPVEKAELVEAIVCMVVAGSSKVLIRFDATPYFDSRNNPFRPIVRGICYPHPTKDVGLGEGDLLLDLNAAVDDAFNLGFDRAKLATIPVTVSDKFAAEDNDSIYFEPGHNIAIEGGKQNFQMLEVKDNIQGMMTMLGMILNKTEQVTSTYPTTMGNIASMPASTTATAIAGAEQRTNLRQNYKSLTFEYTFLTEFYWLILQMVWRFARKETVKQIMKEDVLFFDPDADYTYSPVTSAIETEYNKFRKIQLLQQLMATVAPIQNPNQPKILNILMDMIFETLSPDYVKLQKVKFDESAQAALMAMQGGGASGSQPALIGGASNQSGVPMSMGEQGARAATEGM